AARRPAAGRPRSLRDARRQLREPLQHPGAQLQGDPAGEAERAPDVRPAHATVRDGGERTARAAVDVRDAANVDGAARAEALPAAQRRANPGSDSARRVARLGAEV